MCCPTTVAVSADKLDYLEVRVCVFSTNVVRGFRSVSVGLQFRFRPRLRLEIEVAAYHHGSGSPSSKEKADCRTAGEPSAFACVRQTRQAEIG